MLDRRQCLGLLGLPAALPAACLAPGNARRALARAGAVADSEEAYWSEIGKAFTVDRSIVNLNNGGVSPSPAFVQDAMAAHLALSNKAPAYYMWSVQEPQREGVRERLALQWGVDKEEIAITRNASESLQTLQFGFDLERGDEVLTTSQDYPRMITTFQQRERRDGIVLKRFPIPTPCEDPAEIVRRYEAHLTDRTRLVLVSHMIFLTGQVMPVREVCALGRARGIPVIVDGAHAFAHLDFRISELECDYYASSLHKWLAAPHGTGLLYVKRDKIAGLWPLMAAADTQKADIRKFEEIGTHPAANALAIAEALTFHQGIGPARKLARLVHLRDLWAKRLGTSDRVRFHTSLAPGFAGGIATVEVEGVDSKKLAAWLWDAHKIFVVAIDHEDVKGIRVSPSVYTTPEEIERFCVAMEGVIADGLPA
jgi:selenocysteine lyase/cysteine desulfurase